MWDCQKSKFPATYSLLAISSLYNLNLLKTNPYSMNDSTMFAATIYSGLSCYLPALCVCSCVHNPRLNNKTKWWRLISHSAAGSLHSPHYCFNNSAQNFAIWISRADVKANTHNFVISVKNNVVYLVDFNYFVIVAPDGGVMGVVSPMQWTWTRLACITSKICFRNDKQSNWEEETHFLVIISSWLWCRVVVSSSASLRS